MVSKEIIEHIDKLVFFKEFTSEEKANVSSFTQNFVLFRGGDLIIKQDSNDPSLYILLYGEVELRKNEQPNVVISTLLPGSIFGGFFRVFKKFRCRNSNAFDSRKYVRTIIWRNSGG